MLLKKPAVTFRGKTSRVLTQKIMDSYMQRSDSTLCWKNKLMLLSERRASRDVDGHFASRRKAHDSVLLGATTNVTESPM